MKNKKSNHGLSYFFRQRIHGNVLALVRPNSEAERSKSVVVENILRWEDDGGQMMDVGNSIDRSNPDMARERANE